MSFALMSKQNDINCTKNQKDEQKRKIHINQNIAIININQHKDITYTIMNNWLQCVLIQSDYKKDSNYALTEIEIMDYRANECIFKTTWIKTLWLMLLISNTIGWYYWYYKLDAIMYILDIDDINTVLL